MAWGCRATVARTGRKTLQGPAWPNIDEDQLTAAAASYTKVATKISGSVVPQQTNQLSKLTGEWQGGASVAASGEATTMIAGHEANAAQAQAIATALTTMAAAVVQTKTTLNAAAEEVQQEVTALQALPFSNKQELIESRIKMGLSQNIATVSAASSEMASSLGTIANLPQVGTPPTAQATQAAQKGSEQMMQMISQLPQMLGQIPQMLGRDSPAALPTAAAAVAAPAAAHADAGLGWQGHRWRAQPVLGVLEPSARRGIRAEQRRGDGQGGRIARWLGWRESADPLLSKMVGGGTAPVSVDAGASAAVIGGVAPVAAANAAGGMGGGMGMMGGGQRAGGGGGTTSGLAVPAPLEHELGDGDDDYDDW